MRIISAEVFDDIITGTASVYSAAQFNGLLGNSDGFSFQACVTGVGGSPPTLTIQSEHSADDQHWTPTGSAEINGVTITNNSSYVGARDGFAPVLLPFIRFKITLGGTNPTCRLKLYVTGRARSAAS